MTSEKTTRGDVLLGLAECHILVALRCMNILIHLTKSAAACSAVRFVTNKNKNIRRLIP